MKFYFFLFFFFTSLNATEIIFLQQNWEFFYKNKFYSATIPGQIHTDLFNNKLIPDPFIGNNENKLKWIDNQEWIYKTNFDVKKNNFDNLDLVFDGLDTYAKVFLNDSLIISANNMFRGWEFDAKNILKEKNNEIKIIFSPTSKYDSIEASKIPYILPQDSRTYSRKAQFQYGWDFAPKFLGCGIWKNVYLRAWNKAKINSVKFNTESFNDSIAKINFEFEIFSKQKSSFLVRISSNSFEKTYKDSLIELIDGINNLKMKLEIPNPQLWWSNGIGKQNLYNFLFEFENDSVKIIDSLKVGIRKIELVQQKDSIGENFYFKLNNIPIFIKGANYVPQDVFTARVNFNDYKKIILSAVNSNMNMLRVWGGGIYADDEFLNLCDEFGILVWQDFMFANSMPPGDSLFFENVKTEATENIKRIRNHPSLALWCGNNEIEEGWFNWGWQKQFNYTENDIKNIWNDYKNIFHKLLPELVSNLNPEINYISSSPKLGWGNKESLHSGDMHYWGVWWGNLPFEEYEKNIPRFMSEFGFQSSPPLKSINKFAGEINFTFSAAAIKNHQKHSRGFKIIESYLKKYFRLPRSLTEYALSTQLLQSFGVAKAIESQRRAKPICMGTMFWQLNEPWPGFTWSAIDFYGEEKILYKTISNLYKPVLVTVEENKIDLNFYVISDLLKDTTAQLEIILFDLNRKFLKKFTKEIIIKADESKIYFTKSKKSILGSLNARNVFLEIKLKNSRKELLSMKKFYFVYPKDLYLNDEDYWKFLKSKY